MRNSYLTVTQKREKHKRIEQKIKHKYKDETKKFCKNTSTCIDKNLGFTKSREMNIYIQQENGISIDHTELDIDLKDVKEALIAIMLCLLQTNLVIEVGVKIPLIGIP